ncbi:hypothetical protein M0804_001044 [Polistes exclamans]|nr:hypothetical protein M0804_001044 [Polistes exclamans]
MLENDSSRRSEIEVKSRREIEIEIEREKLIWSQENRRNINDESKNENCFDDQDHNFETHSRIYESFMEIDASEIKASP